MRIIQLVVWLISFDLLDEALQEEQNIEMLGKHFLTISVFSSVRSLPKCVFSLVYVGVFTCSVQSN